MPNAYTHKLNSSWSALIWINQRHLIRRLYGRSENAIPALAHLSIAEDDVWDDSYSVMAVAAARMECAAPNGLVIEGFKLHCQVSGILVYLLALL